MLPEILAVIQGIAASVGNRRGQVILHRDAITAVDKVTAFANTDITTADNGAGTGVLLQATTYDMTVIPRNRYGPCSVAATINTRLTGGVADTHSIRLTFAQAAGAEWYEIFLSDAAAPLWVARVTEEQRAAGDYEVTAVGTVAAGGGNPAGSIDVNVVGTGVATSHGMFVQNNAYRIPSSVTPINCTGKAKALIKVLLELTDLRAAIALRVVPLFQHPNQTANWHQGSIATVSLLGATGQSLLQEFLLDVNGATGLMLLVDTLTGQGASVSLSVELA